MEAFADIADYSKDERIRLIGASTMRVPADKIIGFITDAEPGKCDRYIDKLLKAFPGIKLIGRFSGPVNGTVLVKIGRRDGYWIKHPCPNHAGKFELECPACNSKNSEYVVTEKP